MCVPFSQDKAATVKVGALQKENLILKRAVQIQNTKLQERAVADAEVLQLRHMTVAFQEQVGGSWFVFSAHTFHNQTCMQVCVCSQVLSRATQLHGVTTQNEHTS